MPPFSTENQPQNRKPRGKGRKTKIKEIREAITNDSIGIDIIEVKKTIVSQILAKSKPTTRELELVNTVVSDLKEYELDKREVKQKIEYINQPDKQLRTTEDIIEDFRVKQ
jgi:isocitrate dehydrogenase